MFSRSAFSLVLLGLSAGLLSALAQPEKRAAEAQPRTSVGITVEEQFTDGPEGGLIIREVAEGSPAAKGGLKKDDLILRVCNRQVDDYNDLITTLAGCEAGEDVSFRVVRDGQIKTVKVKLAKASKPNPKDSRESGVPFLGVLGVPLEALHPIARDRFGYEDMEGVVVLGVVPGSPAAKAALRHGDLIKSVGGQEVSTPDEMRARLQKLGTGKSVSLKIQRGEHEKEVNVTPTVAPVDVRLSVRPRRGIGSSERMSEALEALQRQLQRLERRIGELEKKVGKEAPR